MVTSILFGVYSAAVAIVFTLIGHFTGIDKTGAANWLGWIAIPFYIFFLWMAMRDRKRDDYGGTISYGQCIGTGLMVGVSAGILVAIFMYIYATWINPGMADMVIQNQMAGWKARGMTADQISRAESMTRFFSSPSMEAIFALLGDILMATIFSLIVALFVRSKPEEMAVTA